MTPRMPARGRHTAVNRLSVRTCSISVHTQSLHMARVMLGAICQRDVGGPRPTASPRRSCAPIDGYEGFPQHTRILVDGVVWWGAVGVRSFQRRTRSRRGNGLLGDKWQQQRVKYSTSTVTYRAYRETRDSVDRRTYHTKWTAIALE